MKIHVSYRLSPNAIAILAALAQEKGLSLASTLELLLREAAKRENIAIKT